MSAFKNITWFHFSPDVGLDLELNFDDKLLVDHQLRSLGSLELSTAGFVPVTSEGHFLLGIDGPRIVAFALGIEERVLPPSAVAYRIAKKIKQIVLEEGRKVGGRERRRIKEDIITEMIPNAPVKLSQLRAILDLKANRLLIDTGSRKKAELVVSHVRKVLGSFPAPIPMAETPPWSVMTHWLTWPNRRLALGSELELQDKSSMKGAKWKARNADLHGEEVMEHLRSGMQATRLGLTFDDACSFDLCEDLTLRKFKLHEDYLSDQIDDSNADDAMRATMFIFARTVRDLIDHLSDDELLDIEAPGD